VHSVGYAFPKVKICTTAVDKILDDNFHIIPGIGESMAMLPTLCGTTIVVTHLAAGLTNSY